MMAAMVVSLILGASHGNTFHEHRLARVAPANMAEDPVAERQELKHNTNLNPCSQSQFERCCHL